MKKTIAMMLALAAISTTAFASPQTTFRPGEFEINAGMWDSAARTAGYKSDGEWNFLGGVSYGISDNGQRSTSTQAFTPIIRMEI